MKKSPLVMTSRIELRLLGVMALCLSGTALGQRPGTSGVQLGQQGFACLFNGKDLTGWEGRPEAWEVQDGAIWCTGKEATRNWLIWRGGQPRDVELRLQFKYVKGNSGVQVRSKEIKPFLVRGYQVEVAAADVMRYTAEGGSLST